MLRNVAFYPATATPSMGGYCLTACPFKPRFFLGMSLVKKQGIGIIHKCICHMQRLALLPHPPLGLRGTSRKGKRAPSTLLGNLLQCDLQQFDQHGASMVCDHLQHNCMRLGRGGRTNTGRRGPIFSKAGNMGEELGLDCKSLTPTRGATQQSVDSESPSPTRGATQQSADCESLTPIRAAT